MQEFAVNHYLLPEGQPLEPFLDQVAATGAGGVGITQRALDEVPAPRLRRLLDQRGLRATSVNSAGFFLHDTDGAAAAQRAANQRLIEAAGELQAEVLVVIPGGLQDAAPGTSIAAARARIATGLAELAAACVGAGVRPGLEVMHPVSLVWKGVVNTLGQAEALCRGIAGLHLVVDVFHSWWDPELDAVIGRMAARIALVQLCNVLQPPGGPSLPRRSSLSQGVVDIGAVLRRLDEAGYSGSFEFEMFADQLQGRDPAGVIAEAAQDYAALRRGRRTARSVPG